jgi:hypothetical protein
LDYSIYDAEPCQPDKESMEKISVNLQSVNLNLELTGRTIGKITVVLKEDGGDFWQSSGLKSWHQYHQSYPITMEESYLIGERLPHKKTSPEEAWIRTVTADHGTLDGKEMKLEDKQIEQISTLLHIRDLSCVDIEKVFPKGETDYHVWATQIMKVGADFIRTASRATDSRAFFITSLDYMGIGPASVKEDDIVCIFPGCRVPLLVREDPAREPADIIGEYLHREGEALHQGQPDIFADSDSEFDGEDDGIEYKNYLLVGECFVWGLMNGEQKDRSSRAGYEGFVFN